MRKAIHKRSTPIRLNDLTDKGSNGINPIGKLTGNSEEFTIGYKTLHGTWKTLIIKDPAVVAEIRDQADAWLEQHPEAGGE